MIITIRLAALRLARAELSKLLTTRALPASFAIAIVLAVGTCPPGSSSASTAAGSPTSR